MSKSVKSLRESASLASLCNKSLKVAAAKKGNEKRNYSNKKLNVLAIKGENAIYPRDTLQTSTQEVKHSEETKDLRPGKVKNKLRLTKSRTASTLPMIECKNNDMQSFEDSFSSPINPTPANPRLEPSPEISDVPILLLKSIYTNRHPTIFFDYPDPVPHYKSHSRVIPLKPFSPLPISLTYKISENFQYPCILKILKSAGFSQSETTYNMNIEGITKGRTFMNLLTYQKTNHFPGSSCLGRKDSMWKNLERMQALYPTSFNFCPATYLLPEDYRKFSLDLEENPKSVWILKPSNSACGKGIKLVNKTNNIKLSCGHVISKYLKFPHLINGFKYDLRVYVAVTSFNPLKIYMYKEGLVRFATIPYSHKKSDLKQKCMHLTNYSINKDSETFVNNADPLVDNYGSKWSFRALKEFYETNGVNSQRIFNDIKGIVIKTLISAEQHICEKISKYSCRNDACYELYGFDILIDKNLKTWLLEVNIFPSLSLTSPLDEKIKYMLITDLYNLIGIVPSEKTETLPSQEHINMSMAMCNRNISINECLLSQQELNILVSYEEEFYRKGEFDRIFPNKENIEKYRSFFHGQRSGNLILWKYLESDKTYLKRCYKKIQHCGFV